MPGVVLHTEIDTAVARAALARIDEAGLEALVDAAGMLIESQTKERIATGKRSPEGDPWAPWSDDHARTRRLGQSLLLATGSPGLLTSVQSYARGLEAEVRTPLVYGAIHQFGAAKQPGIPARPYLGLSAADREEIDALVIDSLEGMLA